MSSSVKVCVGLCAALDRTQISDGWVWTSTDIFHFGLTFLGRVRKPKVHSNKTQVTWRMVTTEYTQTPPTISKLETFDLYYASNAG